MDRRHATAALDRPVTTVKTSEGVTSAVVAPVLIHYRDRPGAYAMAGNDKAALAEVQRALNQAKGALMHKHHELLEDPRNGAEGLEGAACGPYIKGLARLAIGAATQGLTAEDWRTWVVDGLGPEAGPLLNSAEGCMRASGLWPWPT